MENKMAISHLHPMAPMIQSRRISALPVGGSLLSVGTNVVSFLTCGLMLVFKICRKEASMRDKDSRVGFLPAPKSHIKILASQSLRLWLRLKIEPLMR